MLKANGSITPAQYSELKTELNRDMQANQQLAGQQIKKEDLTAFEQKLAWAAKTQIKGDVRVRQETIKLDGEPNTGGRDKDRQRISDRRSEERRLRKESVEKGRIRGA